MAYILKRLLLLIFITLPCAAQSIFNCSAFVNGTAATCGISISTGSSSGFWLTPQSIGGSGNPVNGSGQAILYSVAGHNGYNLNYQSPVNTQAFSTTFTFVAGSENIAFYLQNNTNVNCCSFASGLPSQYYSSGAGGEGGWFQSTGTQPISPNNIFAWQLVWYSGISYASQSYTYSAVQVHQTWQTPNMPSFGSSYYWPTDKITTSPVPLTNPANTQAALTTDVFSVTLGYDGSNFSMCMYDVTAAHGSCSSATSGTGVYFQKTWANVDIPALVGSNTAYVGLSTGSSGGTEPSELINSWSWTQNSAPSTPSLSSYTSGQTFTQGINQPPTPTFSPVAGTYAGTQSVTIASAGSSYICYKVFTPVTSTSIYPATDNYAGCASGSTLYTGPVSIPSTSTIVAIAGYTHSANTCAATSAACGGPPSNMSSASYTINPAASTYKFSGTITLTGTGTITVTP